MKFWALFFFTSIALVSSAQTSDIIRSGRPGFRIGAFTVGKGIFQNQTGYYFRDQTGSTMEMKEEVSNRLVSVCRYGIRERVELGFALAYSQVSFKSNAVPPTVERNLDLLSTAIRINILDENGLKPSIGTQLNVDIPKDGTAWLPENSLRLSIMTRQNMGKFRWITNLIISTKLNYVLFVDYDVTSKVRFFAEHYSTFDSWNANVDFGFTYLVTNNFQLDLQGGYSPEKDGNSAYFLSTGVGWRIRPKEK